MSKIKVFRNIHGIEGLCVIEPKSYDDARGYFMEAYNKNDFFGEGLTNVFIQDNEVFSCKGVLRGFHVNKNHPQGKLVRVVYGEIYDVVIDFREGSNTYKKWCGINLSEMNKKQLYIPEGFGHAYFAIKDSLVIFKVTTNYLPGDEIGFAWDSDEFCIDWPTESPIQNELDKNSPDFSEIFF